MTQQVAQAMLNVATKMHKLKKLNAMNSTLGGMHNAVGQTLIKKAYESGVKYAEDLAASNDEINDHLSESAVEKVINKLRVGWSASKINSDKFTDRVHSMAEAYSESPTAMRFNSNSPDVQQAGLGASSWQHLQS